MTNRAALPNPEDVLLKMNLSRAAKKFREQTPQEARAEKPAKKTKEKKVKGPPAVAPAPVPQPAPEPTPPPEPVAAAPAEAEAEVPAPVDQPKKVWPEKAKRPRFVREKAEKRERASGSALPPRSSKFSAQLLTKNLTLPPKDEAPKTGR